MKQIKIYDRTLCKEGNGYSFKEKLEIAKHLDKLNVDVIELPEISDTKADALLIKTILSFVKNSTVSVAANSEKSIYIAAEVIGNYKNASVRIELPVSVIGMEYSYHKKPDKMLLYIENTVKYAVSKGLKVEFCALDTTRTEIDFLIKSFNTAANAGAVSICAYDNAAEMLPDCFAKLIGVLSKAVSVPVGAYCDNKNGIASANGILAARAGADFVKTSVGNECIPLESFAMLMKNCGNHHGMCCSISYTELNRTVGQILRVIEPSKSKGSVTPAFENKENEIYLDKDDTKQTVCDYAVKLGYDLSSEDIDKVYEEFLRVAAKKKVGSKEIEAIIANNAMQVPETYKLETYAINTGNTVSPSAQMVLKKGDNVLQGIGLGDGPIDAAFLTLEKIFGRHFELDDFEIQAVTEGKEAMGRAVVKLRNDGKLYSGSGISTDILGASIRAYISAVNKIVYEEAQ